MSTCFGPKSLLQNRSETAYLCAGQCADFINMQLLYLVKFKLQNIHPLAIWRTVVEGNFFKEIGGKPLLFSKQKIQNGGPQGDPNEGQAQTKRKSPSQSSTPHPLATAPHKAF